MGRISTADASHIEVQQGEGYYVFRRGDLVHVAVKVGPNYFGEAFKPEDARTLARNILGEADDIEPAPPVSRTTN